MAKNPNIITSTELLIDETAEKLQANINDARKLLDFVDVEKPSKWSDPEKFSEKEKLADDTAVILDDLEDFFAPRNSDLLLNEGLYAMDAKLSHGDRFDNNPDIQRISFALMFYELSQQTERPDLYDRMLTTATWLRAAKIATKDISKQKAIFNLDPEEIYTVIKNNPEYLEQAYLDMQENHAAKFVNFVDNMKEMGKALKETIEQLNDHPEYSLRNKEHIISEDIRAVRQSLVDAGSVSLAMIPTPEDNFELNDLPEEQLVAYTLNKAFYELEEFAGYHGESKKVPLFHVDHGLRALGDVLGNPEFHGPQYDKQIIAFALRFSQLASEETNDPTIRERLKTVAVYMRAAKLAEKRIDSFFISDDKIAEIAREPELLEQAKNELDANEGALFKEFHEKITKIGAIFAQGAKKYNENPEWGHF